MYSPQYYVGVNSIKVNGSLLSGVDSSTFGTIPENKGTIFDSGTTLAIVPDLVYNEFTKQVRIREKLGEVGVTKRGELGGNLWKMEKMWRKLEGK